MLWLTENCCNWAQKVNKHIKSDRENNSRRNCSAAWSGAPCGPGDDGDFGITENLFPLGSPFAYRYRGTQNGWELFSHPPYSLDLAPSDYHLFGHLKDHLRGHHYETDKAVQETMRSWWWIAGMHFYHRGIFKILQHWQKCIDWDGDRKVIKDA
jgi:hypothetical protein